MHNGGKETMAAIESEEKVLNALTIEFEGITKIMSKTELPYYVCISILRDLERENIAESTKIGSVIKWRKKTNDLKPISEPFNPILTEGAV